MSSETIEPRKRTLWTDAVPSWIAASVAIGAVALSAVANYYGLGFRVSNVESHQSNQDLRLSGLEASQRQTDSDNRKFRQWEVVVLTRMATRQNIDIPNPPE